MTRRAPVIAAFGLALALSSGACGGGASPGSSGSTTSRAPATASTSTTAGSTTAGSSTTNVPSGDATLLSDDDAVLVAPAGARAVDVDPDDPCAALARGDGCETVGDLVWVTATMPTDRSPVTVYRLDGGSAVAALAVDRGSRAEYAFARVEVADLDGAPGDELIVGLRNAGTGGLLQIDVVGPDAEVVAHLTLDRGRAALEDGALRTWAARYLPDDPNCCPSRFQQSVVGFAGGRWSSYAERELPPEDVPEGDFPTG